MDTAWQFYGFYVEWDMEYFFLQEIVVSRKEISRKEDLIVIGIAISSLFFWLFF